MPPIPPLVREAMKKAGVVWVAGPPRDNARACWLHWTGDAAYLVTGPGEQPLPEIRGTATVTARSATTGGRIVTWVARIESVEPGSDEWNQVVPALVARRLNAPDSGSIAERWARHNTILRLVPTGELLADGPGSPAPSETP
ncbi:MAG TPA: hypothetical protein VHC49_03795 [Mycobacteriales bacterium]|nr:hypothetical protein [Mycobacteriales bacterium]